MIVVFLGHIRGQEIPTLRRSGVSFFASRVTGRAGQTRLFGRREAGVLTVKPSATLNPKP